LIIKKEGVKISSKKCFKTYKKNGFKINESYQSRKIVENTNKIKLNILHRYLIVRCPRAEGKAVTDKAPKINRFYSKKGCCKTYGFKME